MIANEDMIKNRREEWIAAVNARDVQGYLDLLTDDVVWFPPGQPAFQGKNAFESWLRPFFDRFSYQFAISDPHLQLAGDWAVERGVFQTKMVSLSDGKAIQHAGKYLLVWRKTRDGIWCIERYIDETQTPEPQEETEDEP